VPVPRAVWYHTGSRASTLTPAAAG